MNQRKISQTGIDLIKSFEGFKADAYVDQAGVWTVGYGTTRFVTPTAHVTPHEAEGYLLRDLQGIQKCINQFVRVPLNQNQFDALCSFVYNEGQTAFITSTLLADINSGHYTDAADQFLRWRYIHVDGVAVPNDGLLTRRTAERKLFLA